MTRHTLTAALTLCALSLPAGAWTNTGGGDHGGADWIISVNTNIAGVHTNIRTFQVVSGVTATIQPYDGTNFGSLDINATTVIVDGTINGDAAGFLGGAGGAGPVAGSCACGSGGPSVGGGVGTGPDGGTAGVGEANNCGANAGGSGGGGGAYGGTGGTGGSGRGSQCCNSAAAPLTGGTNTGAFGAGGSGPGAISKGPGGGGGGSASAGYGCGAATNCASVGVPGGTAGAAGGARIYLSGTNTLRVSGTITANGGAGGNGGSHDGGIGCSRSGGGGGGGAAGGGILLSCANGAINPSLIVTGTLRVNGGAGGAGGNGGTGCTYPSVGGDGGQGGGAGRIKVYYQKLSDGTATYQLNGGAGGAAGTEGCVVGGPDVAGTAGGNGAVEKFCTDTAPPSVPVLVSPGNGGFVFTSTPTLTWNASSDD